VEVFSTSSADYWSEDIVSSLVRRSPSSKRFLDIIYGICAMLCVSVALRNLTINDNKTENKTKFKVAMNARISKWRIECNRAIVASEKIF